MKSLILALIGVASTCALAADSPKPTPATAEERAALNAAEIKKLNLEISYQQSQIQMLQTMDAVYKAQADVDKKLEDIRKAHGAAPGCAPKDDGAWKCPEPNPPPAKK